MNVGKTLFAQVMEFVPWKTFGRIVERHKGDAGVRTLTCADLFRVMAFAQLTWRESLRDIEACLAANQTKLFHMGMKVPPARSTLADALERRDWRIYHALAQRLIARAKALYEQDPSVLELDASVYALDSTTIDLCLSLFDWAPFRSTKAAVKLHTLLDLLLGQGLPGASAARPFQGYRVGQDARLPDQQHGLARLDDHGSVQRPLAGRAVLQVDQAAPAHQAILRYQRERGEGTNLVRRSHLRVDCHCQERASTHCLAVHMSTDLVGLDLRENRDFMRLAAR